MVLQWVYRINELALSKLKIFEYQKAEEHSKKAWEIINTFGIEDYLMKSVFLKNYGLALFCQGKY
jgi:hypothetical protein